MYLSLDPVSYTHLRIASRTGVLLTPNRFASAISIRRSPGANSPVMIACLNAVSYTHLFPGIHISTATIFQKNLALAKETEIHCHDRFPFVGLNLDFWDSSWSDINIQKLQIWADPITDVYKRQSRTIEILPLFWQVRSKLGVLPERSETRKACG